jgi:hypothetical protein
MGAPYKVTTRKLIFKYFNTRYLRGLVTEYVGVVEKVQGRGHLRGPGSRMSVHVNTGR